MIKYFAFLFVFSMFASVPVMSNARAATYAVDKENSQITFSGLHAGNAFNGQFKSWQADITFDETNLKESTVAVTFDTASAKTGNAMYDGTLPSTDWFDTANHKTARFTSTSFAKTETGYSITGDLTIRDITKPVTFDFTLSKDNPVTMEAGFTIDRLAYNIGKSSDANAEWVGRDISVKIKIVAAPQ